MQTESLLGPIKALNYMCRSYESEVLEKGQADNRYRLSFLCCSKLITQKNTEFNILRIFLRPALMIRRQDEYGIEPTFRLIYWASTSTSDGPFLAASLIFIPSI